MVGGKLKYRVQASTIMEVVVAMVVIIIVFGIAMMIFSNVMRLSVSEKKIKAQAILQEVMLKAEKNGVNITQTFTIGDFTVEQKVNPYQSGSNLIAIQLTAYDRSQQKVFVLHKIISSQP